MGLINEILNFRAFLVNKSIQTCFNWYENTINQLCVLDMIPPDRYQQIFVFEPTYRVICGADLIETLVFGHFGLIYLFRPASINLRTLLINSVSLIGLPPTTINNFLLMKSPARGNLSKLGRDWFDPRIKVSVFFG